jgi:chemotaxis protein methyltransferase CheR
MYLNNEEVELLIASLHKAYGYDFTGYSRASFKRRLARIMMLDKYATIQELEEKLKADKSYFQRFIEMVTVNVTEMFRDPEFYAVFSFYQNMACGMQHRRGSIFHGYPAEGTQPFT